MTDINGIQKLSVTAYGDDGVMPLNRVLSLVFKNIQNGIVKVFANGKPVSFTADDNHCITVEIDNFTKDICYEITVVYAENAALDKAKESVQYFLLRTEDNTLHKKDLFLKVKEVETVEEIIELIKASKCNANTKRIVLEALIYRS